MSLTDIEQEKIKEWLKKKRGIENSRGCSFFEIDMGASSYFEDCNENMDVTELQFSDIQQLRAILESKKTVIKDRDIDLICAVAVFKRKHCEFNLLERVKTKEDKILPDFIYHF